MSLDSRTASAVRSAGAVTFAVDLIFLAAGVEALAAFNACVADPACSPDAGALNAGAFFAILAAGIALAVAWVLGPVSRPTRTVRSGSMASTARVPPLAPLGVPPAHGSTTSPRGASRPTHGG